MTKTDLKIIKEVIKVARMEQASFEQIGERSPLPTAEALVTPFIVQRTRLYRDTWIIYPLEGLVRRYEEKGKVQS
jgi:hypothetical protein